MKLKKYLPLALASTFLFVSSAIATNSINVQTFNPSTSDHFVFLEDGFRNDWPKQANYYFGANYNYTNTPLVATDATQSEKAYNIIDNIQTFDLFAGFRLSKKVGLFLGIPIDSTSFSPQAPLFFPRGSKTSLGDLKVEGKIRLTEDDSETSVAFIPEVHLPTGDAAHFVSDSSAYLSARFALERRFTNWTLAANLGYVNASNAIYKNSNFSQSLDYRNRIIAGIGGFLPFTDIWGMNVEFSNTSMIPFVKTLNPNDAYIGLRFVANDGLIFTGGGSLGEIGGPEGQNWRLVAGIRYTLSEDKSQTPKPIAPPAATPTPVPTPVPAVHVEVHGSHREIVTPSINFENNSFKLLPDSQQTLDVVAELIIQNRGSFSKIYVDGHTSNVGKDKYNLNLSIARAKSVKHYLVTKGVHEDELLARGFGMRQPKVLYNQPGAIEINRRVEFLIMPLKKGEKASSNAPSSGSPSKKSSTKKPSAN